MRRISLLLVSLIVLTIQAALAQSFSVKGTVVSAGDNEPLIGVTILQEGTTNGVVTDFDGNFTIEVKGASKATLVISYIGMVTQKHSVNAQTKTLNVALASDTKVMDEVVVVAYGVRKKGTIAGSVSSVKSEKIENVPAASFDQALQGQSTGLQVISASGEPSKAATFQIRGTNSINSGKSPLFILDGVPISSSDFNTLSPNDIESISVLKDASSTSIYGARAANGVIVITSKRGLAMYCIQKCIVRKLVYFFQQFKIHHVVYYDGIFPFWFIIPRADDTCFFIETACQRICTLQQYCFVMFVAC